jgi:acetolactate synthase-1/2/3 large subunit
MAALAERLSAAKQPIVILGGSGWTPEACGDIQAFAEAFQLPVACSFRRQDLFDNQHPLYVGDVGIGINPKLFARIREADVVLAIGARLGEMTTSGYTMFDIPTARNGQALIHVHPDSGELGRVVQPTQAFASGLAQFAAAARALVPAKGHVAPAGAAAARADYEAWQAEPALFAKRPDSLNLYRIVKELFARLPADTLLANGAGNFATWGHRFRRYPGLIHGKRSTLAPTSGAMGYGVPAGIAAKIHDPAQTVVVLAGDGDFMMTGQELATAVQEGAAVLFIVINNGMYGTIRMHQERHFPGRVHGTALRNPDFVALARAYGAFSALVVETGAFAARLDEALQAMRTTGLPALLELRSDPEIITPGATLTALRTQSP